MEKPDCVRLPFLCPDGNRFDNLKAAYLWPGLPDQENDYWRPEGYPFSETQAQCLLNDIDSLQTADLEAMLLSMNTFNLYDEIKKHDEMSAIADFAGSPNNEDAFDLIRKQAHKVLIWWWKLEQTAMEISRLERACAQAEQALSMFFTETPPIPGMLSAGTGKPAEIDRKDGFGAWQTCVASAMIFIPSHMPVLAEGEMLAVMLELPGLEQNKWTGDRQLSSKRARPCQLKAPLWKVLGRSRPFTSGIDALDEIYNSQRIWLGWL